MFKLFDTGVPGGIVFDKHGGFWGGFIAGALAWVGGLAIARTVLHDNCANKPVGRCWNAHDNMSGLFNALGNYGVTPAYLLTAFVLLLLCAVMAFLLRGHNAFRLMMGMLVAVLLMMVLSSLV